MQINCTLDTAQVPEQLNCDLPYLTQLQDTNNNNFYVSSLWSAGELFICLALTILICIEIFKFIFYFFFPRVVKIKSKYNG